MRRNPVQNQSAARPRPVSTGFTLLELLVVMGIIVFLVSLSAVVMRNFITTSREAKTKTMLTKLNGMITKRVNDVNMAIQAQDRSGSKYLYDPSLYNGVSPLVLAGNYAPRAKVLGQKALFRNAFPQTLAEAKNAGITLPSNYIPANDNPVTQSSEALYLTLTQGASFGPPPVDLDAFKSDEIDDTDGDKLMEFVDGWGQPIRFYRWPTRLVRPAPQGSETTAQSLDKNGNYVYGVNIKDYSAGNPGSGYSPVVLRSEHSHHGTE